MTGKPIEFWYEFASPYSYLAAFQIEQAAETAQIRVSAGPPCGAGRGGDAGNQFLARVDIHAGVFISEAVLVRHYVHERRVRPVYQTGGRAQASVPGQPRTESRSAMLP